MGVYTALGKENRELASVDAVSQEKAISYFKGLLSPQNLTEWRKGGWAVVFTNDKGGSTMAKARKRTTKATEEKEAKVEVKEETKAEPKEETKAEVKEEAKKGVDQKLLSAQERRRFMAELIATGKHTKNSIVEKTVERFPEISKATIQTNLTDGKNPKYNKFESLVVIGKEERLSFKE